MDRRRSTDARDFVGQILGELRRTGYVEGRRGRGGGFRMAVAAEGVSVLDVVEALDGDPRTPEPASSPESPAAVLRVWEEARVALDKVLSAHTIAEIAALERASTRESDHQRGGTVKNTGDRRTTGEARLTSEYGSDGRTTRSPNRRSALAPSATTSV